MTIVYSVGNEHSPTDPWGRSALWLEVDGSARVEHVSARVRTRAEWAGNVGADAVEAVRAALRQAGFPQRPAGFLVPDTRLAQVTVGDESVVVARSAPAYAEAFDLLDGLVARVRA